MQIEPDLQVLSTSNTQLHIRLENKNPISLKLLTNSQTTFHLLPKSCQLFQYSSAFKVSDDIVC